MSKDNFKSIMACFYGNMLLNDNNFEMLFQTFKVFTDVILTNWFSLQAHSFVVVGFSCVCVRVGLFIIFPYVLRIGRRAIHSF